MCGCRLNSHIGWSWKHFLFMHLKFEQRWKMQDEYDLRIFDTIQCARGIWIDDDHLPILLFQVTKTNREKDFELLARVSHQRIEKHQTRHNFWRSRKYNTFHSDPKLMRYWNSTNIVVLKNMNLLFWYCRYACSSKGKKSTDKTKNVDPSINCYKDISFKRKETE